MSLGSTVRAAGNEMRENANSGIEVFSVSGLSFLRLRAGVVRVASGLGCNTATFALCQCDGVPSCPLFVP